MFCSNAGQPETTRTGTNMKFTFMLYLTGLDAVLDVILRPVLCVVRDSDVSDWMADDLVQWDLPLTGDYNQDRGSGGERY